MKHAFEEAPSCPLSNEQQGGAWGRATHSRAPALWELEAGLSWWMMGSVALEGTDSVTRLWEGWPALG